MNNRAAVGQPYGSHRMRLLGSRDAGTRGVRCALCLLWFTLIASCGGADSGLATDSPPVPAVSAEQQRLEDFFARTWDEDLVRYPASASYLGVTDYQDQWNNASEAFQLESLEITRQRLAFLEGIDTAALSPERLYRIGYTGLIWSAHWPVRHFGIIVTSFISIGGLIPAR